MSKSTHFFWIDTDAGIDDALAILLALKFGTVLGISCSYGNISCDKVMTNVQRVLNIFRLQYPETHIPIICVSSAL